MPEGASAGERPGIVRRLAAGAWHVPAGFGFLFRNPSLWPLALLPAGLAVGLLLLGFLVGFFAAPHLAAALVPGPERVPDWLGLLLTLSLWLGSLAAGMALGLAVALLLAAPALEILSRRVEALARGQTPDRGRGLRWELLQSLVGGLYFLGAAPLAFAVSLIPLVGPVLGALWAGQVLAFQLTDGPLTRRGLGFRDKRSWHRHWRGESLGFGLGGVITLVVPLANVLLGPALAVGATLLVINLESGQPSPAVREQALTA